jgi:subtilase family protein
MRRPLALMAVLVALAVSPAAAQGQPPAKAGRLGRPAVVVRPGVRELMALAGHRFALLELASGHAVAPAERLLRRHHAVLVSRHVRVWRVPTPDAEAVGLALERAGHVRAIEPDRRAVPAMRLAADPLVSTEWWRPDVRVDAAPAPGAGVPITILDSGLDMSHPEFAGRPNTVLLNDQQPGPGNEEEHGTAVSSVAAAPENGVGLVGVYPQAVLREWDDHGLSEASVVSGIDAAIGAGAGVISMSFGFFAYSQILADEVYAAFGTGSLLVASAGNDFTSGNRAQFPGDLYHVLTIAATNERDEPASFSSSSLAVDLSAPGQDIPVAVPRWSNPTGYDVFDGTSFSAPLVAGAAAWVWTRRSDLDVTQIFDLMRFSARDVWDKGYDEDTGFGIVDIPTALSQAAPASEGEEPNEDIYEIKAGGLFDRAARPLTAPGRRTAVVRARLDITEDPEDVYRVWIPARSRIRIAVVPTADVDVELWNASTPSVQITGAAQKKHLLAYSSRNGTATENVTALNRRNVGVWVYLDLYIPDMGPSEARYTASLRTTK